MSRAGGEQINGAAATAKPCGKEFATFHGRDSVRVLAGQADQFKGESQGCRGVCQGGHVVRAGVTVFQSRDGGLG